jgi:tyrosine-protein kinase Etk/Wzc
MMANCDVPIYVFKANYSKRNFAERVEELVEVQKIKKLSIILNGAVSVNKSYGYGGHYGYYEEKETKKSFIKRIFGL